MKNCHKLGIKVHGTFIVGLPVETPETVRETIEFAEGDRPAHDSGFDRVALSGNGTLQSGAGERLVRAQ